MGVNPSRAALGVVLMLAVSCGQRVPHAGSVRAVPSAPAAVSPPAVAAVSEPPGAFPTPRPAPQPKPSPASTEPAVAAQEPPQRKPQQRKPQEPAEVAEADTDTPAASPSPQPSAPSSGSPKPSPEPRDEDPGAQLWGRGFTAVRMSDDGEPRRAVDGTDVETAFERRRSGDVVRWRSGCNTAGAQVDVTPRRLLLEQAGGTDVGCSQELHEQERWVTKLFLSDPLWEVDGDRLRLQAGDDLIVFERSDYW